MRALVVIAALSLVACGGKSTGPAAKTAEKGLPPANPLAVQRMVEGVTAAKDPKTQTRAIALLREATTIDPNLWEARFDLGVVLANAGDLANAEEQLRAARVIEASEVSRDTVSLGSQVTVEDESGKKSTYMIVGSAEADPLSKPARISNESPVGRALLGRKKGEKLDVSVPQGTLKLKVASISAP